MQAEICSVAGIRSHVLSRKSALGRVNTTIASPEFDRMEQTKPGSTCSGGMKKGAPGMEGARIHLDVGRAHGILEIIQLRSEFGQTKPLVSRPLDGARL